MQPLGYKYVEIKIYLQTAQPMLPSYLFINYSRDCEFLFYPIVQMYCDNLQIDM